MRITSCNGGIVHGSHSFEVPTVLFACTPTLLPDVEDAAATLDRGLADDVELIELFADDLRKMNRFAPGLLDACY